MYASAQRRLFANALDFLLFLPFAILAMREGQKSLEAMVLSISLLLVAKEAYVVACHKHFAQTLGKHLMGIKLQKLSHHSTHTQAHNEAMSELRWSDSLRRSSIDMLWTALRLYGLLNAASIFFANDFLTHDWPFLQSRFHKLDPTFGWAGSIALIWFFSESLTMLLHRRKQSLQDLLASTIVISAGKPRGLFSIALAALILVASVRVFDRHQDLWRTEPQQVMYAGTGIDMDRLLQWKTKGLIHKDDQIVFFHAYEFDKKTIPTILTTKHLIVGKTRIPLQTITAVRLRHDFADEIDLVIKTYPLNKHNSVDQLRSRPIVVRNLPRFYGKKMADAINLARKGLLSSHKSKSIAQWKRVMDAAGHRSNRSKL